ncbi:MAG TPA: GDSL-type esterase/lipase family protein [Fimbriiglobus sp.]|jgi:lysophospholipase L1-like esterase
MLATFLVFLIQSPSADPFAKWEKEVSAIEKRLKESPPKKGGIVFAGSSTIRLWNLKKSFPDWNAVNCGFGGNQIRDNTHFAARLIFPLEPRAIVFYAGDNDVNAKRTPEQVRDDFRAFVKTIHDKMPECKIYYLPIKPSVARWAQYQTQSRANALVKADIAKNDTLTYIDYCPLLLGPNGKPNPDLLRKDGLHMNDNGYAIVSAEVRKTVK